MSRSTTIFRLTDEGDEFDAEIPAPAQPALDAHPAPDAAVTTEPHAPAVAEAAADDDADERWDFEGDEFHAADAAPDRRRPALPQFRVNRKRALAVLALVAAVVLVSAITRSGTARRPPLRAQQEAPAIATSTSPSTPRPPARRTDAPRGHKPVRHHSHHAAPRPHSSPGAPVTFAAAPAPATAPSSVVSTAPRYASTPADNGPPAEFQPVGTPVRVASTLPEFRHR